MDEKRIAYFHEPGVSNTDAVLELAKKRAGELGIRTIIVATTEGGTGAKASAYFKGYNLVVVTHAQGFGAPNENELTEANRAAILANGAHLFTGPHPLASIGAAFRRKFNTYELEDVVSTVLRMFGHGMKVACEIAAMAVDAGLARTDEDAVAIGGSHRGADTAVVLRPANSRDFFDIRVKEIICKPMVG
jgi:uncharacterized protein